MLRTLLLVSLPAAITIGTALQASAKTNCTHANRTYSPGAVTCGCPRIDNRVVTIPQLDCKGDGTWALSGKTCGTVELNDNANTLRLYIELRRASKC